MKAQGIYKNMHKSILKVEVDWVLKVPTKVN